jgi:hypothetical protein
VKRAHICCGKERRAQPDQTKPHHTTPHHAKRARPACNTSTREDTYPPYRSHVDRKAKRSGGMSFCATQCFSPLRTASLAVFRLHSVSLQSSGHGNGGTLPRSETGGEEVDSVTKESGAVVTEAVAATPGAPVVLSSACTAEIPIGGCAWSAVAVTEIEWFGCAITTGENGDTPSSIDEVVDTGPSWSHVPRWSSWSTNSCKSLFAVCCSARDSTLSTGVNELASVVGGRKREPTNECTLRSAGAERFAPVGLSKGRGVHKHK